MFSTVLLFDDDIELDRAAGLRDVTSGRPFLS